MHRKNSAGVAFPLEIDRDPPKRIRTDSTPTQGFGWGRYGSIVANPDLFHRPSEVLFQGYYQAHLDASAFFQPAISYIPTPDASALLERAWAVTLRFTQLL
ncbi:MAG TPA: hypothetical protein VN939_23415 [Chthoniobacterales bacterium]|nr:hypothetical protein [Chthoniobacterales bacterium]